MKKSVKRFARKQEDVTPIRANPLEFAISCIPNMDDSTRQTEAAKYRTIRKNAEDMLSTLLASHMELQRKERFIAGMVREKENFVHASSELTKEAYILFADFLNSLGYSSSVISSALNRDMKSIDILAIKMCMLSKNVLFDVFTTMLDGDKEEAKKEVVKLFESALSSVDIVKESVEEAIIVGEVSEEVK